eukprot:gene27972-8854_t
MQEQTPAMLWSFSTRRLLAASLLVLALAVTATDDDITCNQSGMCSVGKVKYYYGPVKESKDLKSALEATTYKKELILEKGCQELTQVGSSAGRQVSCGWDDTKQHKVGWTMPGKLLWHLRWRLMARASRVGYNILSLDRWMDDDLNHTETLFGSGHQLCLTFDDSLHSTIAGVPITRGAMGSCMKETFETHAADGSVVASKKQMDMLKCEPRMKGAPMDLPTSFPSEPKLGSDFRSIMSTPIRVPGPRDPLQDLKMGGPASPIRVPSPREPLQDLQMEGPIFSSAGGEYTDEYFAQLKGDCPDLTQCPWWKDSHSDSDREAAANIQERCTWWKDAPSKSDRAPGGRSALKTQTVPLVEGRPVNIRPSGIRNHTREVMVHFHYLPSARGFFKASVSKLWGGFDWKLSKALHSTPLSKKALAPGPYFTTDAPEKVLVLSPYIDLSRTRNYTEFKRIQAGLVQLALMSGRSVVHPDIFCNTSWPHKTEQSMAACTNASLGLLKVRAADLPYAARVEPWNPQSKKEFRICSGFLADEGCLGPVPYVSGLLNIEFEEWVLHDLDKKYALGPTKSNTMLYTKPEKSAGRDGRWIGDAAEELAKFGEQPLLYLYIGQRVMAAEELATFDEQPLLYIFMGQRVMAAEELAKFDDQPLLYLGQPVLVKMDETGVRGNDKKDMTNWKVKFMEADLLQPAGWMASSAGCEY